MKQECMMETILSLLRALERRMVASPPVDNTRTMGLALEMFPDGSGTVYAYVRTSTPTESDDEKVERAVFADQHPILEFHNIGQLHGGLVAATCAARRSEA
jgi:hypothetical protein